MSIFTFNSSEYASNNAQIYGSSTTSIVSVGFNGVGKLSLRPPKRIFPYIVSKYSSTIWAIGYVLIIVKSKDGSSNKISSVLVIFDLQYTSQFFIRLVINADWSSIKSCKEGPTSFEAIIKYSFGIGISPLYV